MQILFISLGSIILIVIVYVIYRVKRLGKVIQKVAAGSTVADLKKREEAFFSDRMQKTANWRAVLLETYPSLKEVDYVPVEEGLFPVSHLAVDDAVKKRLEEKVSSLPPVSAASLKLLNLLQDPESNPGEITSLVSTNPVFSAKVLQTVNSVYFRQSERVISVGRAITLLGYSNVRSLVLEDVLYNATPSMQCKDRELYVKVWIHSAVVSACAGHLGKSLFRLSEYTMGTIGLLHDIGKYFFQLLERRDDSESDFPAVISEEKRYGMNHAVIGAVIAHKWQLPENVTETIEHHHSPSFFPPESVPQRIIKECFIVCLSDLICKVLGYAGQDGELLPLRNGYYERFGLNKDLSDLVTPALVRDIEKAHQTVLSYMDASASAS